jgi:subtilisin family serine protease
LASSSGDGASTITTNRLGDVGYAPVPGFPDYTNMFGGTSSAAPLAAGIGALVLSQAPCMSAGELRQLLRDTADKIGPEPYDANGFNPLYGYGRINGGRALAPFRPDPLFSDRFEVDGDRMLDRNCDEPPGQ